MGGAVGKDSIAMKPATSASSGRQWRRFRGVHNRNVWPKPEPTGHTDHHRPTRHGCLLDKQNNLQESRTERRSDAVFKIGSLNHSDTFLLPSSSSNTAPIARRREPENA